MMLGGGRWQAYDEVRAAIGGIYLKKVVDLQSLVSHETKPLLT